MTCMQCRHMTECKDDAFVNDAKFCPNESAKYCIGFEPFTNADRIRAMSDWELAQFIVEGTENSDFFIEGAGWMLLSAFFEWLQQPAEMPKQ